MTDQAPVLDKKFDNTKDDKSKLIELLNGMNHLSFLIIDDVDGNVRHSYFGIYKEHTEEGVTLEGPVYNTTFLNGGYNGHGISRRDSEGDHTIPLKRIERMYTPHRQNTCGARIKSISS